MRWSLCMYVQYVYGRNIIASYYKLSVCRRFCSRDQLLFKDVQEHPEPEINQPVSTHRGIHSKHEEYYKWSSSLRLRRTDPREISLVFTGPYYQRSSCSVWWRTVKGDTSVVFSSVISSVITDLMSSVSVMSNICRNTGSLQHDSDRSLHYGCI